MISNHYQSCIQKIFSLPKFRDISNGIESMYSLSGLFSNPHTSYKIIHIAGTNGKGSVSLKCARALESAGYKTGLYTSPHIFDFRERISINSSLIPSDFLSSKVPEIFSVLSSNKISVNFFEVITMLAFIYFEAERVDYAVIEVGMGGRLDATNIVSPELAVITQIGLDHCEVLGDTIEKIAYEKAGIIKPGRDCVVGADTPIEYYRQVCEERGCKLVVNSKGDRETFEQENSRLAELALSVLSRKDARITPEAIAEGIRHKQPFREQHVVVNNGAGEVNVILDVGHNPSGLERLMQDLALTYPNLEIHVMLAMSLGKSIRETCEVLARYAKSVHCVSEDNGRLVSYNVLVNEMIRISPDKLSSSGSIHSVLPALLSTLAPSDLLVICGSFYMMQDIQDLLSSHGACLKTSNI